MATLADQIKSGSQVVKRGGQLFEAAPESLFATVQKQGLVPGAAVSPEVAAGMGVTADQAKMAGSSAQLQSAVRESIVPQKQFKEAAARTTTTTKEAELRTKQKELEGLKELGTRVGGIVNDAIKEAAVTAAKGPAVSPILNEDRLKVDRPNLSDAQREKVTAAITTGTLDAELYTIFGINPTDVKAGSQLAAELEKYKKPPAAQVVAAAQELLGDDVTLSQFKPEDWQALGLDGVGELGTVLGIDTLELSTMSLSTLQDKINALASRNFGQVEGLQRVANDPFYPDNVRQEAQSQLRDLSSVGVQATEADMQNLNEAVQSGTIFNVGGTDYTVAELLTDATMSSVVKAYLEDTDGTYKEQIVKDLPDLASFIEANKNALAGSTIALAGASDKLATIQQDNAKLGTYGAVDLKEFNKLAIEGYDPKVPSNTLYPKTEAHKILELPSKVLPDADKTSYATFLSQMATISPEAAKQFSNFSLGELNAFVNASGLSWDNYFKQYATYQSNLSNLNDSNLSADRAVHEAFGGQQAYLDAQAQFKEASLMRTFGVGKLDAASTTLLSLLDANGDGKMDDVGTLREKLKTYFGNSVNVTTESIPSLLKKLTTNVSSQTGDTLYKMVQDGIIDNDELLTVLNDGMMTSRVYDLLNKKTGGLSAAEGGMATLTTRLADNAVKELDTLKIPRYADSKTAINEAQKWLDSQPKEMVTQRVADGFTETFDAAASKNAKILLDKTMIDIDNVNRLQKEAVSESQRAIYKTTLKNLQAIRNSLFYITGAASRGIAGRQN